MAEGYSYNPDEEKPKTTDEVDPLVVKKPEAVDRFRAFIGEIFKPKESKEKKEEDDEDKESLAKKSRFSRLWRSLFPSVATQENIAGETVEGPRHGLFFEAAESEPLPDHVVVQEESAPDLVAEVPLGLEHTEVAAVTGSTEVTPPAPEATETLPTVAPVVAAEAIPTFEDAPEITETPAERPVRTSPELVVVGGLSAAERHRLHNVEGRERDIEHEVKRVRHEVERKTVESVPQRPEVKSPEHVDRLVAPTAAKLQPEKANILNPQYETEKTPEVIVQSKETFKDVEKQAIIENILNVDTKEIDGHKEISYELSHEHKDMDKQTAGTWAALQASAEAQAKANAAAIAAAQNVTQNPVADIGDVALKTQDDKSIYKKAALGGFVSAIVIIAIIIVIILIQSN